MLKQKSCLLLKYRKASFSLFLITTAISSVSTRPKCFIARSSFSRQFLFSFVHAQHITTDNLCTAHPNSQPSTTAVAVKNTKTTSRSTTTTARNLVTNSKSTTATTIANNRSMSWEELRNNAMDKCIVPLSSESHKGSSGRVGVLGGSAKYTGAPYYAAMASLKAGADLAYVFCAQEAALPIKSYSPELMVAPVYSATEFDKATADGSSTGTDEKERLVKSMVKEVTSMMGQLHSLVIGPGLGRCPLVFEATSQIIQQARSENLALVLDADALYMLSLSNYRSILDGYDKVVLTPNVVEYKRLFSNSSSNSSDGRENNNNLNHLQVATIVQKGLKDIISVNGIPLFTCEEIGGLKRSGGIGDVLAGSLGALVAWHVILKKRDSASEKDLPLCCWTGCCFVKRATKLAFELKRRSMTAPDVLEQLGPAIDVMTMTEEDLPSKL